VNVETPEGADLEYIDRLIKRVEVAIAGNIDAGSEESVVTEEMYAVAYAPEEHEKVDGSTFKGPSDLGNIKNIYTKAVSVPEDVQPQYSQQYRHQVYRSR
jgi:hypothetical protein